MGTPKITKPSALRKDLYNTLERVAKGKPHVVSTKKGDVVIMSKADYDAMLEDMELLKEFEEPVIESDLVDAEEAFSALAKANGLTYENQTFKKRRKKSR